jgi:hypothetical protein
MPQPSIGANPITIRLKSCDLLARCGKMSTPTYLVTVVHLRRQDDYQDFGELGLDIGRSSELPIEDILGFMEPVRASKKREAYIVARSKYPKHQVINNASRPNAGNGLARSSLSLAKASHVFRASPFGTKLLAPLSTLLTRAISITRLASFFAMQTFFAGATARPGESVETCRCRIRASAAQAIDS